MKAKLHDIFPHINKRFLFHTLWQVTPESYKSDPDVRHEIDSKLSEMLTWAKELLTPTYKYRFYSLTSRGAVSPVGHPNHVFDITIKIDNLNNIHLYDIAFQIVTLGDTAIEKGKQLRESSSYSDYFYWHGFCAALTEAFSTWLHIHLQTAYFKGKNIIHTASEANNITKRISFGYPPLPILSDQRKVLKHLHASVCGVHMTSTEMLDPEYSSCAMLLLDPTF
jgi:hypothetical protein